MIKIGPSIAGRSRATTRCVSFFTISCHTRVAGLAEALETLSTGKWTSSLSSAFRACVFTFRLGREPFVRFAEYWSSISNTRAQPSLYSSLSNRNMYARLLCVDYDMAGRISFILVLLRILAKIWKFIW